MPSFLRTAPWRLVFWLFLPMVIVGLAGELLEKRLAGTPGNPSTLHAVKWLAWTFFKPSLAEDSWMPMTVALDVTRGPRASELFQAVFFEQGIKFQYPPSSLLPLEPLAYLGLLSYRLLNGLNSVILALNSLLVAALAYRLFRPEPSAAARFPDRRWAALLGGIAGLSFYPIVQAHNLGQIQTWIDLLFTAACLSWLHGRGKLAGVAIGLACALKPQLALFLPWALVWRKWDFALGLVSCLLPIGLLSLARYGLANHLAYLDVLSHLSRHGESFPYNQSVNGLMHRLFFNGCNVCPPYAPTPLPPFHPIVHYATLLSTLAFLAIGFVPALLRRRKQASLLDFSVATLCFTMASPVAWFHHYGVALPIFVIAYRSVLDQPEERSRRHSLMVLAVAWILASNYIGPFNLIAGTLLNPLQSHLFFGAILLLWILVGETRKVAATPGTWLEPRAQVEEGKVVEPPGGRSALPRTVRLRSSVNESSWRKRTSGGRTA